MRERILSVVSVALLWLSLAGGVWFIRELYRASVVFDAIKHKRISL